MLPIRTQIVGAALAHVRACGGDPQRLIDRFSLPVGAETAPDVVVPLPTLHALLDELERVTGDPFLGVHMAARFPRGLYGLVEYIARNCATVREGLHRIVHYASLVTNRVEVTFEERGGAGIIRHAIAGEPLATGRHSNEFFISAIVLQARELCGARFVPTRVWFAHAAPSDRSELVARLGTDAIAFGVGENGVELAADVLDLPIRSADPALLHVLDREVSHVLDQQPLPLTVMDAVRAAIEQQLGERTPSLADVARVLRTSARTLQRRLGQEGRSFRDVVEEVRERRARDYLGHDEVNLGELASRLGYAELSAFLRAFKRWTGMTPTQFRDVRASRRT